MLRSKWFDALMPDFLNKHFLSPDYTSIQIFVRLNANKR